MFYDSELGGAPIRAVQLRTDGGAPVTVQVAETRVKRQALANEIMVGVILPQLLLIAIVGVVLWAGVARGLSPLARLQQAIAARSHLDLSPVERCGRAGRSAPAAFGGQRPHGSAR